MTGFYKRKKAKPDLINNRKPRLGLEIKPKETNRKKPTEKPPSKQNKNQNPT